ncbi:MAG: hypothetical protein QOI06_854 [Nocardioidaceae bacterium]|jgi:hypothetical protein|nr:hypothetical protein [Nocardioidaceae bacterium]
MADSQHGRAVDFNAWLTSRSAALTRFAYLVTGSETAAEISLSVALTKAGATWSRLRRNDDPEAEVCRLVVEAHMWRTGRLRGPRAAQGVVPPAEESMGTAQDGGGDTVTAWRLCAMLPPAQRAAVVLRCHAQMTYPQIAGVLGTRESDARAHVDRAFESLRISGDRLRSDDQLEDALRDAFAEHADDLGDVVDAAAVVRAGVLRHRRRGLLAGVVAAVLLVGGLAVVEVSGDRAGRVAAATPGLHPRAWRVESYNGIQLWVPSSWGWGEVPRRSDHGLDGCGVGAYSRTSTTTALHYVPNDGAYPPYVGRPTAPGSPCPPTRPATAAHVWFDSPLPPGVTSREATVRVHGLTAFDITVADRNLAERRTILRSVQPVDVDANGCPRDKSGLRRIEAMAGPEPSPRFVRSVSLCLFSAAGFNQVLFYSTRVDGSSARQSAARIEAAPARRAADICLVTPASNEVVLIARTTTVPSVFGVHPGTCPRDRVGFVTGSSFHVLTRRSVGLWAIDGLSLYASADPGSDRLTPLVRSR